MTNYIYFPVPAGSLEEERAHVCKAYLKFSSRSLAETEKHVICHFERSEVSGTNAAVPAAFKDFSLVAF